MQFQVEALKTRKVLDHRHRRWRDRKGGTCSDIRNDKYPPFDSTWMELEGIMLSEVSQSEKDKHYMFHSYGEYKK